MRGLGTVSLLACLATACGSGPAGMPEPSPGHASPSAAPAPGTAAPAATATATVPRTAAPRTGATAVPVVSQPVTSPAAFGRCGVTDVGITTTTDARSYTTGQTVAVSVVVRNLTRHGCVFAAAGIFHVMDAGEDAVFAVRLECAPTGCPPLAPGQRSLYPIPWDQRANQGTGAEAQVPPGTYHAEAAFQGYPTSSSDPFGIA